MSSVPSVEPVLQQVDRSFEESVGRLCDLLRIPSISTDPAYKGDVRRAADWLVRELTALGFDA